MKESVQRSLLLAGTGLVLVLLAAALAGMCGQVLALVSLYALLIAGGAIMVSRRLRPGLRGGCYLVIAGSMAAAFFSHYPIPGAMATGVSIFMAVAMALAALGWGE